MRKKREANRSFKDQDRLNRALARKQRKIERIESERQETKEKEEKKPKK